MGQGYFTGMGNPSTTDDAGSGGAVMGRSKGPL